MDFVQIGEGSWERGRQEGGGGEILWALEDQDAICIGTSTPKANIFISYCKCVLIKAILRKKKIQEKIKKKSCCLREEEVGEQPYCINLTASVSEVRALDAASLCSRGQMAPHSTTLKPS